MSSVEFAMTLPFFLLIIFAIVEFGTAFHKHQVLTSTVREAARFGSVATGAAHPGAAEIKARALSAMQEAGLDSGVAVVSVSGAGGPAGTPLTVGVEYPLELSLVSALGIGGGLSEPITNVTAQTVVELQ